MLMCMKSGIVGSISTPTPRSRAWAATGSIAATNAFAASSHSSAGAPPVGP